MFVNTSTSSTLLVVVVNIVRQSQLYGWHYQIQVVHCAQKLQLQSTMFIGTAGIPIRTAGEVPMHSIILAGLIHRPLGYGPAQRSVDRNHALLPFVIRGVKITQDTG